MGTAQQEQLSYERLAEYAETDKQREACLAMHKHQGDKKLAMQEMGMTSESAFRNLLSRVRAMASVGGYAPDHDMTKIVPDPFKVKRVSSFYREGELSNQWVIAEPAREQLVELMRTVVEEMKTEIPVLPPMASREDTARSSDLLNLFVLTDAHIGMLAWHEESGENWDLKIAEDTINQAFDHLIACSPVAKTAFFCQLGDGLHTDGLVPVTPANKNVLDSDGRYQKIVRTAIRVFRRNILRLMGTHDRVVFLSAMGNHDPAGSVWLQEMFSAQWEDNPQVEVIVSPKPFYAYQHGKAMLGFHHGDKVKVDRLPEVFVGEFRQMYGATDQTFLHCGDKHHKFVKEFNSAIVEQHTTLAARDAYASSHGYKSMRAMQCITYHRERLEIGRVVYRP